VFLVWTVLTRNQENPSLPQETGGRVVGAGKTPGPATGKVLFVLAYEYDPDDYGPARKVLQDGGKTVVVASSGTMDHCSPVQGKSGERIKPDVVLGDAVKAADYDALVIPGGYIHEYKDDKPPRRHVWRLIEEMQAAGKYVGALSSGLRVLGAKEGLLQGKPIAMKKEMFDQDQKMSQSGAKPIDQTVVEAGTIITGLGVGDGRPAEQFAHVLLKRLNDKR
jgi:putative intracellular protease/amidase